MFQMQCSVFMSHSQILLILFSSYKVDSIILLY